MSWYFSPNPVRILLAHVLFFHHNLENVRDSSKLPESSYTVLVLYHHHISKLQNCDLYDVILAPKMTPFSPKMTNFDKIEPINDTFDKNYLNKPD